MGGINMAFDLSDEELKATRIMNGTASKEELYERIVELEEIEKEHQKENGELRERVEELEKYENYYKNERVQLIPKSKVRKKLEEYNKMINATYGDITHQGDIRRDNCIEIRNVLQELLEERR
jgi:hypothetical protein